MRFLLILSIGCLLAACSPDNELLKESEQDFCSQIHPGPDTSLSAILQPFEERLKSQTAALALEDGGNAMMTRAWLCEHAQKSIDIQYFIFATDNVGLIACDYLVKAAERGVKVRMLIDDILVDAGPHEILSLAAHQNIEIKIYNPGINLGKNIFQKIKKLSTDFYGANQRMHNKTFTVDEKVVITGGRNIADEYFDYDHAYNFRDRDVLLFGKSVKAVHRSFEDFWNSEFSIPVESLVQDENLSTNDSGRYERLRQYACNPENFWPQVRQKITELPIVFQQMVESGNLVWADSVQFVSDQPGKNVHKEIKEGGATTSALAKLIQQASKEVLIQSPYLVTTEASRALLADACKRGVKIRILTNSLASTDNLEAFSGYQRDRDAILATGAQVFEFRPDAKERYEIMTGALQKKINYQPIFGFHAKSMVIDEKITVIGTFNFDPRSANYNTECVTIIHSKDFAEKVRTGMQRTFQPENSWETTLKDNPDKFAGTTKQAKTLSRRVIPKGIL